MAATRWLEESGNNVKVIVIVDVDIGVGNFWL